MASFYILKISKKNFNYINLYLFSFFYIYIIETKVIVDVENNKSQSQDIRTLAKFEFFVQNIILELFKEGPDKVMYSQFVLFIFYLMINYFFN